MKKIEKGKTMTTRWFIEDEHLPDGGIHIEEVWEIGEHIGFTKVDVFYKRGQNNDMVTYNVTDGDELQFQIEGGPHFHLSHYKTLS